MVAQTVLFLAILVDLCIIASVGISKAAAPQVTRKQQQYTLLLCRYTCFAIDVAGTHVGSKTFRLKLPSMMRLGSICCAQHAHRPSGKPAKLLAAVVVAAAAGASASRLFEDRLILP